MKLIRTIIVIGGFLVLVGLGTWQMQRLAWKEELLQDLKKTLTATRQPLQPDMPVLTAVEFRGRVDGPPLALYRQGRQYLILTIKDQQSGRRVLVNAGYSETNGSFPRVNKTAIIGLVRYPEDGFFIPKNQPGKNAWYRIDPATMGQNLEPYFVEATVPVAKMMTVRTPEQMIAAVPNNHLQYAVTWFSLAGIYALFVYLLCRKKQVKK